ncbi:MAG: hypothetical protein SGI92_20255 [Bryobacteraceae bacterium]|nr:hypothetical protein [Bryobacteraceae bacterium]
MKLRLNDTSVRLRFRKSEVLALSESGTVTVTLPFPGSNPITFVARAAEVPEPAVSFRSGVVEVLIPAAQARCWYYEEAVGIYGNQDGIDILLEKDFRRSSAASPDDDDRYPNPRKACSPASLSVQ